MANRAVVIFPAAKLEHGQFAPAPMLLDRADHLHPGHPRTPDLYHLTATDQEHLIKYDF